MKTRQLLFFGFFILLQINMMGQLKITAELRARGELFNSYKYLADTTNETQYYVTQRTRLNFDYKKDFYELYISLQDVRAWGGEDMSSGTIVLGSSHGLDIYEASAKFNLSSKLSLKIGRQEYDFDDRRILCNRNWNQYGLSYDGLLLSYKTKRLLFMAQSGINSMQTKIIGDVTNKNNEYYDGSKGRMKTFNFIYLRKDFNDEFYVTGAAYLAGYQKVGSTSTVYGTGTYGLHLSYKNDFLEAKGNIFMQSGKNYEGKKITGAMMATAMAQYNGKKIIAGLGLDHYSGHNSSKSDFVYNNEIHTFNLMYGARFPFNGNMNMYMLMDKHTKNGGLDDLYGKIGYKFNKKHNLTATYHLFSTAEYVFKGLNGTTKEYYEKNLGSEIDLMYKYIINKEINIMAGGCYYFTTEATEAVKGVGAGTSGKPFYSYLMVTFKPNLYNQKD